MFSGRAVEILQSNMDVDMSLEESMVKT